MIQRLSLLRTLSIHAVLPALALAAAPAQASPQEAVHLLAQPPEGGICSGPGASGPDALPEAVRRSLDSPRPLDQVLIQEDARGSIWARGSRYRAQLEAGGLTYSPAFGPETEQPLILTLDGVQAGPKRLELQPAELIRSSEPGGHEVIGLDHGSLREHYALRPVGIEQSFVFDDLPARGELRVRIGVETSLTLETGPGDWVFRHPELGYVTYGMAVAFDATGASCAVERRWTGEAIELIVPAGFVDRASLPLVIDPLIQSFVSPSTKTAREIDMCFAGLNQEYWVVYTEAATFGNADCFALRYALDGTILETVAIDLSTDHWRRPRIAYLRNSNRLLVVATKNAGSLTGPSSVVGRLLNATTGNLIGGQITISSIGSSKTFADVGGSTVQSLVGDQFCVVWAAEQANGNFNVKYRLIKNTGGFSTPITEVTGDPSMNDVQLTISERNGDFSGGGPWWTLAWTRDSSGLGFGSIWARDIVFYGAPTVSSGNVLVQGGGSYSWPSISAPMDDAAPVAGRAPSVLAYTSTLLTPSGSQNFTYGEIQARVLALPFVGERVNLSADLMDVDSVIPEPLTRRSPRIASDDEGFVLTYEEEYWGNPGGGNYDLYMLSGHVCAGPSGPSLALAERHSSLAATATVDGQSCVVSRRDGDPSASRGAAAIWLTGLLQGTLKGASIDYPALLDSDRRAVGVQFCDAVPNSTSSPFAPSVAGWTWIEGTGSVSDFHTIHAQDMPNLVFGYLFSSMTSGEFLPGGNNVGRLCVFGGGRYLGDIQSSGTMGTMLTNVQPGALLLPNGPVAAQPGETWHFQYWHRDFVAGSFVSNFTNAVSVTFTP